MKTFKLIVGILLLVALFCLSVNGLIYVGKKVFKSQPQYGEPKVTQVNDTTYHIDFTKDVNVTLQKSMDTLFIYPNGYGICYASPNDSIYIYPSLRYDYDLVKFKLNYKDYFNDTIKECKIVDTINNSRPLFYNKQVNVKQHSENCFTIKVTDNITLSLKDDADTLFIGVVGATRVGVPKGSSLIDVRRNYRDKKGNYNFETYCLDYKDYINKDFNTILINGGKFYTE